MLATEGVRTQTSVARRFALCYGSAVGSLYNVERRRIVKPELAYIFQSRAVHVKRDQLRRLI